MYLLGLFLLVYPQERRYSVYIFSHIIWPYNINLFRYGLTHWLRFWVLSQTERIITIVLPFAKLSTFRKCWSFSTKMTMVSLSAGMPLSFFNLLSFAKWSYNHTTVIYISAWLRTHYLSQWASQFCRKIGPYTSY